MIVRAHSDDLSNCLCQRLCVGLCSASPSNDVRALPRKITWRRPVSRANAVLATAELATDRGGVGAQETNLNPLPPVSFTAASVEAGEPAGFVAEQHAIRMAKPEQLCVGSIDTNGHNMLQRGVANPGCGSHVDVAFLGLDLVVVGEAIDAEHVLGRSDWAAWSSRLLVQDRQGVAKKMPATRPAEIQPHISWSTSTSAMSIGVLP